MKTRIMICSIVLLLSAFTGSVFGAGEGNYNTFYGYGAGNLTTGDYQYDSFFGNNAGCATTTGIMNTFMGYHTGWVNTSGSYNTFLGHQSGWSNTTANNNTFVGFYSGNRNTTGEDNTFLGFQAGFLNTTAYYNTFLGYNAGYSNTTGYMNTFLGYNAGYNNTTSYYNTFLGPQAGYSNTTGIGNTFIGLQAGYSNTTGGANIFLGNAAGYSNTAGTGNLFLGYFAGSNETGSNKLYIDNSGTSTPLIYGEFDSRNLTINGNLEVIGPDNGLVYLSNTTADSTVKVSRMVVHHYTNAQEPVYLFGAASTATNNFVALGGGSTLGNAATRIDLYTAANPTTLVGTPRLTIIGNGYVGIGIDPLYPLEMASGAYVTTGGVWTNASSREYKKEINELSGSTAIKTLEGLNPVTFKYRTPEDEQHVGFIAEDVPELVATKDRKGLSPMDIVAVLTKVVQEQQKTISTLREELDELKGKVK